MASVSFKVTRNDISPKLSKLAAAAKHPEPVFRAMGTTFMSITMGNFNDAGAEYRPKPWAPKKDGTPSKLQKSGTLSRSFHLTVTDKSAVVSNPTIYAATHQFGRPTKTTHVHTDAAGKRSESQTVGGIPARPFFPVDDSGKLTPAAEEKIAAAGQRAIMRQVE